MERVDVVELEPAIRTVAQFCAPVNRNALAHPKVHLWFGDAREAILAGREQYDLIVSEPSNPYRAGVAGLFSREYYEASARRLRPGGLFVQWIQAYEVDGASISTVYATLTSVFLVVETWKTQAGDLLFLVAKEPIVYNVAALRGKMQQPPFQEALARVWRVTALEGVFGRYIANSNLAHAVALADLPINTDDRTLLEFAFGRTVGRKTGFDIEALRGISRSQGYDQPILANGQLDWIKVADARASATLLEGSRDFDLTFGPDELRTRTAAKAAFAKADAQAALQMWRAQTQGPGDLMELLLLAYSLAVVGDDHALAYLERLRGWLPTEADAVQAQYLWRKQQFKEAFACAERAFRAYQTDPWPLKHIMAAALEGARVACAQTVEREQAAQLLQTLQAPFVLELLETERAVARLEMAKALDGQGPLRFTYGVITDMEPNVPWTLSFLRLRAESYAQAGDRRAPTAAADLDRFAAKTARPFLFTPRDQIEAARNQGPALLLSPLTPGSALPMSNGPPVRPMQ
jgi:hypothetical protein